MEILTFFQKKTWYSLVLLFVMNGLLLAQKNKTNSTDDKNHFSALKFRSIGPAFPSGRIADFAVNPQNKSEYYVAVACGNVWKTVNSGTTWKPIFENYGSYSTASIVTDPNNSNVLWLGTGEYNSQRAIGYGDGVYRSSDGGNTWINTGLKKSEHIGRIVIDPRNSHVYVAAQGPLWGKGGERGIYKTTDNGKTWQQILFVSENTGFNDIIIDPNNPDILYASAYQRRRHVWTLIDGGKESAIYKSVDAGKNWVQLKGGLPSGDVGRIGLAISPVNTAYIYALIELPNNTGGFYRSENCGASWLKMSSITTVSPQYYQRIVADPKDANKVYSLDTYSRYTEDGGKTWKRLGLNSRHVDDHALWIDPDNTRHLLIGGDGGIYETYDHGETWEHKQNLPVTQFYRVSTDNATPFYNVYGGTQDNNTLGGPSQTKNVMGIENSDWFITVGGDGFKTQIDPLNPNIVYSQWQYGGLIRYDKSTTEIIDIKPQPLFDEAYRWNWNSPLIISPHSHTRLYYAANKLFCSNNRGDSWEVVSPDLTTQTNRNELAVMEKIQFPDAVAKNTSTSFYGNIVALCESPIKEGLLYVGTDDGLIQKTNNGGKEWIKYTDIDIVPQRTYVSCIIASQYDENVVYASFDNRKQSDFLPYIYKSTDQGKTWKSIASNLPKNGSVFTIVEDHLNKELLFIGTEYGVFYTLNGGDNWMKLSGSLPTTAVKDMVIQKRENDLVIATFGRGIYILDDYSPLQYYKKEILDKDAYIFPVKDARQFIGQRGKNWQGSSFYVAPNPAYGATFTYYLKNADQSLKTKRKNEEQKAEKNEITYQYPSNEDLTAEHDQEQPYLLFTITNEKGELVRNIKTSQTVGVNRIVWDLQSKSLAPPSGENAAFAGGGGAVVPGKYFVTLSKVFEGKQTVLTSPIAFNVVTLDKPELPVDDYVLHNTYRNEAASLMYKAKIIAGQCNTLLGDVRKMKAAVLTIGGKPNAMSSEIDSLVAELVKIHRVINGNSVLKARSENEPPSLMDRVYIANGVYNSVTNNATKTMKQQFQIAVEGFKLQQQQLEKIEVQALKLSKQLQNLNAPWTPQQKVKF